MNELSLFTGAGGGLLGTKLLGWTPIGYVENDEYCQKVIAQRIRDGLLPEAPLFGDIRSFIGEGYARGYQGVVDVVTAGFPCQPFSVAGKRKGEGDERNLWPETLETIRQVRPPLVFLENVPGLTFPIKKTLYRFVRTRSAWIPYPVQLVFSPYLGRVLGDLAESGYDARWRVLSAGEVGAPHKRDRLWIVAYDSCARTRLEEHRGCRQGWKPADALEPEILRQENGPSCAERANTSSADVAYANKKCEPRLSERTQTKYSSLGKCGADVADAAGTGRATRASKGKPRRCCKMAAAAGAGRRSKGSTGEEIFRPSAVERFAGCGKHDGWWDIEPPLGRVAHGVADRVGQLRALGNGQVPAVVASVWRLLMGGA